MQKVSKSDLDVELSLSFNFKQPSSLNLKGHFVNGPQEIQSKFSFTFDYNILLEFFSFLGRSKKALIFGAFTRKVLRFR